MATNEEMKMEFSLFGDVWRLYKTYYDVASLRQQDYRDYWMALMNDIDTLNHKYNNALCRDLLIVVLDDLERKAGKK